MISKQLAKKLAERPARQAATKLAVLAACGMIAALTPQASAETPSTP